MDIADMQEDSFKISKKRRSKKSSIDIPPLPNKPSQRPTSAYSPLPQTKSFTIQTLTSATDCSQTTNSEPSPPASSNMPSKLPAAKRVTPLVLREPERKSNGHHTFTRSLEEYQQLRRNVK
ncbi:unnamed protein product [Acanthoscelides obtectus]|uniref:Uncharacterized protein n=1 Tax=Acanthoscelides obtectus TaxID=200917 RepID=A0A9P0JLT2_ACAOB|nr:unnamed protein product [Acanthoscelides obtectus]CAK1634658.1 hypothetical protein AOBTE_LOCUS8855 [Acanthoscelides obtectus]